MTGAPADVLVLGTGVIGLTAAICLAESGLRVAVQAADEPLATTSVAAGALWGQHLVGMDDRVPRWAEQTRQALAAQAAAGLAAVHDCAGLTATTVPAGTAPEDITSPVPCDPADLPPGYVTGWRHAAPLIAMPEYLGYLSGRLAQAGGVLLRGRAFGSLAEAAAATTAPVLVSCPGAGARELVPDPSVVPVRGQVVVLANPGLSEFFVGYGPTDDKLTYLFPHAGTVVVGGTQEYGRDSRVPDPDIAEQILARAVTAEPRLAGARVLDHRVGLRPTRPSVRLEAQTLPGGRHVVHNYGHGGAGVSLSWGCAADAAALAASLLS